MRRLALASLVVVVAACDPAEARPPRVAASEPGSVAPCAAPSVMTRAAGCVQFTSIALGEVHSCALTSDGRVLCWGANSAGQLGDGTGKQRSTPELVHGITDAAAIFARSTRTCVLSRAGVVSCFGANQFGESDARRDLSPLPKDFPAYASDETDGDFMLRNVRIEPSVVALPSPATTLSLGVWHTCAALASGEVTCWGRGASGALGDVNAKGFRLVTVPVGPRVVELASGTLHTCARDAEGGVTCFGANEHGQLGDFDGKPSARRVRSIPAAKALALRDDRTCVQTPDDGFTCFGDRGACGTDDARLAPAPFSIVGRAKKLALGSCHFCVLRSGGEVECASTIDDDPPTLHRMEMPFASDLVSGDDHTCAIAITGPIYCWGSNGNGQLGRSGTVSDEERESPAPVNFR